MWWALYGNYRLVYIYGCRYFRHDEYQSASCVTIQVGNVTADRELTYEYGVRSKSKGVSL